jgi:hypothetical protein
MANQEEKQMTTRKKAVAVRRPVIIPATPMDLMAKAVENPNFNVDAFEKLVQLQREQEDRQARRAFAAAMSNFQSSVAPIVARREVKDRGGNVRYKFASFDDIMSEIKTPLAEYGLAISFTTKISSDGYILATCTIVNEMGHSEMSEFTCPIDKGMSANESQKMGSANSYAKRYCLINALNLSIAGEDDDGLKGGGNVLSDEQAADLQALMEEVGADTLKFLAYYGVASIADLPVEKFGGAMKALEKKRAA